MNTEEFYKNWRKEKGITIDGYKLLDRQIVELMEDFHLFKLNNIVSGSCSHKNTDITNVRCTVCYDCGDLIELDI